jgi:hypothetical protein
MAPGPSLRPTLGAPRLALPLLALLVGGCDLVKAASSTVIVGGLVVKSPEIKVEGYLELPAETGASVWLGERESATSTETPKPIKGARVALTYAGNAVPLTEQMDADGVYLETSLDNDDLSYAPGAAYTFSAELDGEPGVTYGGTIRMAPEALTPAALTLEPRPTELVERFQGAGVHPKGEALKLSWGTQYGRYAYVSVLRARPESPDRPELVFDNRPKTTNEILRLVVGSPITTFTIPGDTFAEDGIYAVLLVTLDKGNDLLPNTFLGSPILAGSGAVVFLAVGDVR